MTATFEIMTAERAKEDARTLLADLQDLRKLRFPGSDLQVTRLWDFLVSHTNWLTAPASTHYHLCVDSGLVIHSVGVTKTAIRLRDTLAPMIPLDSVILCGLFHDVGKVWGNTETVTLTYEPGSDIPVTTFVQCKLTPRYEENILKSGKRSEPAPFRHVDGGIDMDIATRSVRLIEKFVDLTEAEAQAVHCHDGQYIPNNRQYAHHEDPLTLILHSADMWHGHVVEGQLDVMANNRSRFSPR